MLATRNLTHIWNIFEMINFSGSHVCMIGVSICAILTDKPITPDWVYIAVGVFNHITKSLLRFTLAGFATSIQAQVSIKRIEVG
jgi:hypothetical protein